MKEQFIPYELALKLKELGYNDICLARFDGGGFRMLPAYDPLRNNEIKEPWFCAAPLWQQAFDWFLKYYNLYGIIIPTVTMDWTFKTTTVVESMVEVPPYNHVNENDYPTYKEARLACLEKLIQIVDK